MANVADDAQIFNVVLGTAGHIDHGKSSLVQALTGIHPDRLKEEQERGITIDLGFAPLNLSNGMRVGIIDVPGHERFIKNMVAGATGIDFVMMVVAADDGVMAQTREHLQIVDLLGVRDGMTVITKKDLVDAEMLALVAEDVCTLEKGGALEGKPVLAVSSKTGEGIAELKALLEKRLATLTRRPSAGPLRMPIQRVFAKEGFGTVVTGVPMSGRVAIGDTVEILPPGYSGRVKGLHAYKAAITQGQAGHSTAINLHGAEIDKREVVRGMVAVTPGVFKPTALLCAELTHLSGTPWPLKHRAPVRFHAGTAEIQGKVLLLEGDTLAAGSKGWVQIALEEPTVAAPGDRFILRHQTPVVTLGGGVIVDAMPRKRKRQDAQALEELQARRAALGSMEALAAHVIATAAWPQTVADLCAELGALPAGVDAVMRTMIAEKKAVAVRADAFLAPARLATLGRAVVGCMEVFFKEHPALGSVERPELKRRLELAAGAESVSFFDEILALLHAQSVVIVESNAIALPRRERKLEGALGKQAEQLEAALRAGGIAPPPVSEAGAALKIVAKTLKEIVKFLIETGRAVEAAPDVLFHASVYEQCRTSVVELLGRQPECTTSEIRQHLGMNRKYVVPLVELLDRKGVTVRVGDKRKLKQVKS